MTATARVCDNCSVATAQVEYILGHKSSVVFSFCEHHGRKHHAKLAELGYIGPLSLNEPEPEQSTALVPAASTGYTAEGAI